MEYSVIIQLFEKNEFEKFSSDVKYFSYCNESYNGNYYRDVLKDVTDRYNSGHIISDFNSKSIEENVYEATKYLLEFPHKLIIITSTSKKGDIIKDMFDKFIFEIHEERRENKTEKLFSEIEIFTKKFCVNNRTFVKQEWIEIVLTADILGEIIIDKVYEIPIEVISNYVSVFYFKNEFGLLEASYEDPNLANSTHPLILDSLINYKDFPDLDEKSFSIIFYTKTDILNFIKNRFSNYSFFNDFSLELQKTNNLIVKIYKTDKKF